MAKQSLPRWTAVLLACAVAGPALAQNRPFSPDLSCGSLKSMVAARGALVISTGPRTYDRFVRDSGFCERTQVNEPAWIASADQPDCLVGYTCKEYSRDDW